MHVGACIGEEYGGGGTMFISGHGRVPIQCAAKVCRIRGSFCPIVREGECKRAEKAVDYALANAFFLTEQIPVRTGVKIHRADRH